LETLNSGLEVIRALLGRGVEERNSALVEQETHHPSEANLNRSGKGLIHQLPYSLVITRLHRGVQLGLDRLEGVRAPLRLGGRLPVHCPRAAEVAASGAFDEEGRAGEHRTVARQS
jgi:hypothetical protein